MRRQDLILDNWAPLSHKQAVEQPTAIVPTWVSRDDQRRIASYLLLAAFLDNVGRGYLRTDTDDEQKEHREYGDAALLVERIVSGVLGDDMQIIVEGADRDLPEGPVVPEEPDDPGPDASPMARAAFDAQVRVWQQRARQAIEEWEADWANQPALQDRQDWLRDWADRELFHQRAWECENAAAGLGDGVYVLALSATARRPVLRVYDPGFYFPVLDDAAAARGFPTTVHMMWETDEDGDGTPDHVRRITWTLGPIRPLLTQDPSNDFRIVPAVRDFTAGPNGTSIEFLRPAKFGETPTLMDGDRRDRDGFIVRRYPWAADEDSRTTCFITDATWKLADIRNDRTGRPVFPPALAMYGANEDFTPMRELDLRIDFLPVVHIPNTPASQEHFGRSDLSRVLQLLDDLASTDTDVQSAAALAGTPMVTVSGANVPAKLVVAPGAAYGLGANGRMDTIDLSGAVKVLMELADFLLERLSVNAQVPGELLGRVNQTHVESGVSRALKLGPFRSLIAVKRLVREPKYRILLRFVQRIAQAGGLLEPGETLDARLVFGSFLPADRKGVIDEVAAMLGAKVISRSTGLRLLAAAGIEIEDIAAELARIAETDFDGAIALADAINDDDAARRYLGIAGESPNATAPPGGPAPAVDPNAPPVVNLPAAP